MAQKRMFSKDIISSDVFISMPLSSQALYFHLCMNADDEGFVDNPNAIIRLVGANNDDIKILLSKRYVLAFESGVIVIKHWYLHNWIRQDRLKPTNYQEEKQQLMLKENGAYTELKKDVSQLSDKCQSNVSQLTDKCQRSIDKYSIDKSRIDKNRVEENNTISATSETEVAPTPTKYVFDCKPSKSNKNTKWVLSQKDLEFYQETYPNINLDQEFRKMKIWLTNNNLKTYSGMGRFIANWLARTNDRQVSSKTKETTQQKNDRNLKAMKDTMDKMLEEYKDDITGNNNLNGANKTLITDNTDT